MIMKDKKGVDLLSENIVYIILVVLFLSSMFAGVNLVGRQVTLYEQVYAKQIALMVEKAEPGMEIEYRNFRMFKFAADNNAPKEIVSFDNQLNQVTVRLSNGKGYDYRFFNDVDVAWSILPDQQIVNLRIIENALE